MTNEFQCRLPHTTVLSVLDGMRAVNVIETLFASISFRWRTISLIHEPESYFLSISRFLSTNLNHFCRLIAFFLLSNSKVVCNVHFLPVKYSLARSSVRAEGLYDVITKIIQTLFTRVREQLEI